jgi:glycosyltransferase involved in cell wall biosynthesis
LIARLRGIRVVLWGHGYYGNESGFKRWFRLFFLRRADSLLVYGSRARALLIENGFDPDRIHVVFNSLDYDRQKSLRERVIDRDFYRLAGFFDDSELPVIIFVGRLTAQKELGLAIESVAALETRANLIFVGDGPERELLEKKAERLTGQVHFFGPCYDEVVLGKLIANADICLSPGEVGLTAIHALSFGTPVCTHDNFSQQMPEVDALECGKTGVFFSHSRKNIAETLRSWLMHRPPRDITRQHCYETVDTKYNPYSQLTIIESTLVKLGIS